MSVCEQMQEVREQRRRAAEMRADELARKDANGEAVDPVEALDMVAAAGLPDDWFSKRVAHYRTRAGQLAAIAREPETVRSKAAAEKVAKEAEAKFNAAKEELIAAWNPAQEAIQTANNLLNNIGTARAQLRQTCLDPAIAKRRREIGNEIMAVQNQGEDLKGRRKLLITELGRLEPQIAEHEASEIRKRMGEPALSYVPGDYNAREHAAAKGSFEQCKAELPQVEAALLAIRPRIEALRAEDARLWQEAEASPL